MFEAQEAATEHTSMGSLQKLNALNAKPVPNTPHSKTLMHVEACINGKKTYALLDTGASHNFIKNAKAKRLGLRVEKGNGFLKTVNTEAKPLDGVVRGIELHLGNWHDKVNFSVASLDDFDAVLGMNFLRQFNAVPLLIILFL